MIRASFQDTPDYKSPQSSMHHKHQGLASRTKGYTDAPETGLILRIRSEWRYSSVWQGRDFSGTAARDVSSAPNRSLLRNKKTLPSREERYRHLEQSEGSGLFPEHPYRRRHRSPPERTVQSSQPSTMSKVAPRSEGTSS